MHPQKDTITRYASNEHDHPWLIFIIILAITVASVAFAVAQQADAQPPATAVHYELTDLPSLGAPNSGGNSINNRDWVAGYSVVSSRQARHAVVWRSKTLLDLGTLGGPNSSVAWNVKNARGTIVGISQTATPEPLGEGWSSAAFYSGPFATGFINLAFAWENGQMRALPTLGGDNGYATGANNSNIAVGWAENTCRDATCVPPQVLQFRPVWWDLDHGDAIHEFALYSGDTSGAATAINDRGQAAGISGICDQAVGRYTAKHAVLWDGQTVIDLGNLGAPWWNTPTAMNESGDVVGFAGDPGFPEGDYVHGFIWTKAEGIKPLPALPGHVDSEPYGINQRRQVVGLSCDADFADCRAVIWENGVVTDLNSLKDASYAPRLERAKDINDQGEITGRAVDPVSGARTAYFARPMRDR